MPMSTAGNMERRSNGEDTKWPADGDGAKQRRETREEGLTLQHLPSRGEKSEMTVVSNGSDSRDQRVGGCHEPKGPIHDFLTFPIF